MAAAPLQRLVVVLGAGAAAIRSEVDLHGAEPVLCPEWSEGQSASLRAGIAALREAEAVVVALGDQPFLSPRAVEAVIGDRNPETPGVRATYGGVPSSGRPRALDVQRRPSPRRRRGRAGPPSRPGTRHVACDGLGRPDDIDTCEELEATEAAAASRLMRTKQVA